MKLNPEDFQGAITHGEAFKAFARYAVLSDFHVKQHELVTYWTWYLRGWIGKSRQRQHFVR